MYHIHVCFQLLGEQVDINPNTNIICTNFLGEVDINPNTNIAITPNSFQNTRPFSECSIAYSAHEKEVSHQGKPFIERV